MRISLLILFLSLPLLSVAEEGAGKWPLWDGKESVESYARRVNLPPTKTIDLGKNVQLEMVLIPAGKFVMGMAKPNIQPPEPHGIGITIIGVGCAILVILLARPIREATRDHRRPQFSLLRFVLIIFALSIIVYGVVRSHAASVAWQAYRFEMARFEHAYPEEKPAHQVTISKPFYMGKYEVTQQQYQQVVGTLNEKFRGANYPAGNLSWMECNAFCNATGQHVHLPTEAEWEYACRAGTSTDFCSGNSREDLDRVAWYASNSGGVSHPVGTKESNAFGLFDMHGNQYEWCGDEYSDYSSETLVSQSPLQGPNSPQFVLRGGTAIDGPECCRSTVRLGADCQRRHSLFGFRVVVPIDDGFK